MHQSSTAQALPLKEGKEGKTGKWRKKAEILLRTRTYTRKVKDKKNFFRVKGAQEHPKIRAFCSGWGDFSGSGAEGRVLARSLFLYSHNSIIFMIIINNRAAAHHDRLCVCAILCVVKSIPSILSVCHIKKYKRTKVVVVWTSKCLLVSKILFWHYHPITRVDMGVLECTKHHHYKCSRSGKVVPKVVVVEPLNIY